MAIGLLFTVQSAQAADCTDPVDLTPADIPAQVQAQPENTCLRLPDEQIPLTAAIHPKNGQTIFGQANTVLTPATARVDGFVLENVSGVTISSVKLVSTLTYGSDLGYGTGFKLMNTDGISIIGNTVDGMFAGIDSRLGAKDLTITGNTLTIHAGAFAGDSDWNGGNPSFSPTLTSAYVFDTYPNTPVESLPGALPIWQQSQAVFCPYANGVPQDCPERVGAVVVPRMIDPSQNPGLLWFRPSPNPSNGSPFFGVKGALINIDSEEVVVTPGGTVNTNPRAENIIITANILRGLDTTCDPTQGIEPQYYPLPPSDKQHAKRGMLITGVRDLIISANTVQCLNFSGIVVADAKDVTMGYNLLQYLERAIYLFHTTETVNINNNQILDNTGGAGNSAAALEIARYAKEVTIENNTFSRVIGFGIRATSTANQWERLISSNILNNTITMAIEHRTANIPITLNNASGTLVSGNTLTNGLWGMELRQDCNQVGYTFKNWYHANHFTQFEAAAFHEVKCASIPFFKQNGYLSNTKANVSILLSRNSNEYLLQRIINPTTYPTPFAWFATQYL